MAEGPPQKKEEKLFLHKGHSKKWARRGFFVFPPGTRQAPARLRAFSRCDKAPPPCQKKAKVRCDLFPRGNQGQKYGVTFFPRETMAAGRPLNQKGALFYIKDIANVGSKGGFLVSPLAPPCAPAGVFQVRQGPPPPCQKRAKKYGVTFFPRGNHGRGAAL